VDPSRKRRVRLVVALTAAILLAGALIYTSFSSATQAKEPSQVVGRADQGQSLQLTGKVVNGSVLRNAPLPHRRPQWQGALAAGGLHG
jgi:cytochrome c-type biogenesis protein CcmE